MPAAARQTDKVIQDVATHCHNPSHPVAPPPGAVAPIPHPAMPLTIVKGAAKVTIDGLPAARVMDMTDPCKLASCVPGGPGEVAKGSGTVTIEGMAAARMGDVTKHSSCSGPIPAPTGKILPPCSMTVQIGG